MFPEYVTQNKNKQQKIWTMTSYLLRNKFVFFSLRISMRLFQNQYLNEVMGKNLIENQEP